jgi:hypothetical protein
MPNGRWPGSARPAQEARPTHTPASSHHLGVPPTVICDRWYADLRVVDTVERRGGAPVRTLARFVVENDRPGAERV